MAGLYQHPLQDRPGRRCARARAGAPRGRPATRHAHRSRLPGHDRRRRLAPLVQRHESRPDPGPGGRRAARPGARRAPRRPDLLRRARAVRQGAALEAMTGLLRHGGDPDSEAHMQALQLTKFGDPGDSVRLVSRQPRQPDAGELLIDVHAAPVHPSDIHLIRGFYGLRPQLPMDLGADGVGTVVQAGSAADHRLVGRRVILIPTYEHGTWAEKTVADKRSAVVVDDHADLMQLAMLGVTPITAQL